MAAGSFVPLCYTQDDMVLNFSGDEKKKGSGTAAPFFPSPARPSFVILNAAKRSEGSRGHTNAVKEIGFNADNRTDGFTNNSNINHI